MVQLSQPAVARRLPAIDPTAAQVAAAELRVRRVRGALSTEQWQRLVHVTAQAIARREAQQAPRQAKRAAHQPRPTPAARGPRFDARRAAANDLNDD